MSGHSLLGEHAKRQGGRSIDGEGDAFGTRGLRAFHRCRRIAGRRRIPAISSLEEEGFKISASIRSTGDVTARRAQAVKYTDGKSDAADELQRIATVDPMWQADVSSLSEYYVTMTVTMHPVESGKTRIDVGAQITGARRARGRRGRPAPVPIQSNGALEKELVGDIQNRLASARDSPS
jgi:hypothetical protein